MKIQATFEYVPGQYFEFFGDDDVWVFINNRLVVDIGGQHTQVFGAVDLDTLNLTEGQNYPFHIFYAERHSIYSNFMMKTSIDLKTEASILAKDLSDAGIINYEIYQRVSKQALSCDFSGATTTDTVAAPSNFTLIGSGAYAEGVPLDSVGVWFGGITIKPGYTGFTINTDQIKDKRALPPGTYQLRFSLQTDETQYDEITFVIDKYNALPIAYARVDNRNQWTSLGSDVDGTTETLNKETNSQWVNTRYPVNIMFDDGSTFDDMVYVNTSNPMLIPCDENGNKITAITLKGGKATFYVKATAPVQDVTILVSSADEEQKAYWRHLSFMEPPVPQVVFACIFDRDGDGRGDSVFAKLSKPYSSTRINNLVTMDSIQLEFGEKFPTILNGNSIATSEQDSTMIITSPSGGFGTVPFTGGGESVYSGKITPFWKYSEGTNSTTISLTSDVTDSIGPVITSADISYSDDGSTVLLVSFSEGLDCEDETAATYFTYFFKQTALERQDVVPDIIAKDKKFRWKLIFRSSNNDKENVPVMGDSIKLVPGVHMDLLHRSTPETNPFVRISGEQKVIVTSAPVVTIGETDVSREIITNPAPTVPKIVKTDKPITAKEVATEYGVQGHYLGDLSISSIVNDEATNIEAAVKNANAKIVEKEGMSLVDLIQLKGFDTVNKQYHLGDEITNARNSHIFGENDTEFTQVIKDIAEGNSAAKAEIKKKLAEKTVLNYETMYFTSLGVFVNNNSGSFSCMDNDNSTKNPYNGNCLDPNNEGKLFLAWNMRSKKGRLVGTGVYIARLSYKIKIGKRAIVNRTQDFLWGVRHGKTKGFTLELN
jgi:fibro-slime domain-containing protein